MKDESYLIKDKRKHHGVVGKLSLEHQFINPTWLLLLCEKTEALAIMKLGLTAERPEWRPLGRQNCCK